MRLQHVLLASAVAFTTLSGCSQKSSTTTQVQKRLTVVGSTVDVKRFVSLQGALRPALPVSGPKTLPNGQAEATVMLPTAFSGEDAVHATRGALAAGLSYTFEDRRSVTTI